jgi:hypothetical protein
VRQRQLLAEAASDGCHKRNTYKVGKLGLLAAAMGAIALIERPTVRLLRAQSPAQAAK